MKYFFITLLMFVGAVASADWVINKSEVGSNVIYGEDDRIDLFDATDAGKKLASSTLALVSKSKLRLVDDRVDFKLTNYGKYMGLCSEETFAEQDTLAFCSGSLIAEDLVLTAGHCVKNQSACERASFVFDFAYHQENQDPRFAPKENVYDCKELIHSEESGNGSDFALVRLDRKVVGRSPLKLSKTRKASAGDAVAVIGHPSGLPTKISAGSKLRSDKGTYFVAN